MTQQTFRVGDIRPNPFRDIANYPYIEDKLDALQASYRNTSVWPTIVARIRDGAPEIAFGHHRVEAARREFGEDEPIPLNIEDLDDAAMLKMMANENMTEYTAAASVTQETVRQVVLAYAEGRIELSAVPDRRDPLELRYAPTFTRGDAGATPSKSYSAITVAEFLGWGETKVKEALAALEETERGTFTPADFRGLTQKQARAAVTGVRVAEREARAHGFDPAPVRQAAARAAIAAAKVGSGHEVVRQAAASAAIKTNPPTHPLPNEIANRMAADIERFWTNGVQVRDRTFSRREVVQLIAANRNAEGVRQYIGSITRALREMTDTNNELLAILEAERVLESVS